MKNKLHYSLSILFFVIASGVSFVFAEFSPPVSLPPEGNVAPPLNTGNIAQVKTGPLGIQITPSQFTIPAGAGLYSDATIGVRHDGYTTVNKDWVLNSSQYALDTNAPISVFGVFSAGPIRSETAIVAPEIKVNSLKIAGATDSSRQLCGNTLDGSVVPCTTAVGSQLQVSLKVTPTSIIPGSSTPITVAWQATSSAESCMALQGDGFSTGGEIWGTDKVNNLILADKETAQYVVVCTDAFGNAKFASAQVVGARQAPEITFSINPATGGWSNGAFFTTGLLIDPNGGGSLTCRKKVEGSAVSITNGWSGQKSGQWSAVSSIPPENSQSINTCYDGCQFKDILTEPNQSALLTIQCSNAGATTTESRWISVGQ